METEIKQTEQKFTLLYKILFTILGVVIGFSAGYLNATFFQNQLNNSCYDKLGVCETKIANNCTDYSYKPGTNPTPTIRPGKDWLTYTNNINGFTLKYPNIPVGCTEQIPYEYFDMEYKTQTVQLECAGGDVKSLSLQILNNPQKLKPYDFWLSQQNPKVLCNEEPSYNFFNCFRTYKPMERPNSPYISEGYSIQNKQISNLEAILVNRSYSNSPEYSYFGYFIQLKTDKILHIYIGVDKNILDSVVSSITFTDSQ